MNTRLTVVMLTAMGLIAVAASPAADACGFGEGTSWSSTHWSLPQGGAPAMKAAASVAPSLEASSINPLQSLEPITGMYRFTFVAQGNKGIPDGTQLDQGFAVWHADGTEIMNSGRAPRTQSFCMGVWAQTGPRSYQLNHWAMSWDSTGTVYVGPTNIQESIKLDLAGNSYSGSFKLIQYSPDGNTAQGSVFGVVSATRIRADSN